MFNDFYNCALNGKFHPRTALNNPHDDAYPNPLSRWDLREWNREPHLFPTPKRIFQHLPNAVLPLREFLSRDLDLFSQLTHAIWRRQGKPAFGV